jgi:hypothetical protein
MENLAPMVSTPRSAKRLLNIYRLIRASVGPDELKAFLGENGAPAAYEPVLVLLAVQVGFPQEANNLFQSLAGSEPGLKLGDFINELKTWDPKTTKVPFGKTLEGSRVLECLIKMQGDLFTEQKLDSLKEWLPKVVRYSFRGID